MKDSNLRDLVAGVFVVLGLGALGYLSVDLGNLTYRGPGGLVLEATFDEIGGLTVRAPVVISGVKVGQVEAIELDEDLRARVVMEVDASLDLPVDSAASIQTAGLLGDQFVAIAPGAETASLESGDELAFTESAISLESLIRRFVHNAALESP